MVLTTSMSKTKAGKKADLAVVLDLITLALDSVLPLKHVLCIHHPMQFKKNQVKDQTFLDFGSEVNTMTPAYATKLDLKV